MRIAVVASPVTPLRPAQLGGAQSFVSDLAVGLARRGHEVVLHCAEGSSVAGVRLATVPLPSDAAAALVMPGGNVPPPAPGVAAALRAMFATIARDGVDAVSQHAFDAPAFELGRGMPILHTLHMPPIVDAVVRAAREVDAAHLAAVSGATARSWRQAGVVVAEVLPNGVPDLHLFSAQPDRSALVAGRISPEKGIEDALAAARIAGLQVRVAGAQYDPAYVVDLDAADRLGALRRDELSMVMSRSAVTICAPHWEEPYGLVAAEAQMVGCPVAAYRRGALPEVVEEGVSGWLADADDIAGLARAITMCLDLDRAKVRASALRRLGLDAALDGYERALARVAS